MRVFLAYYLIRYLEENGLDTHYHLTVYLTPNLNVTSVATSADFCLSHISWKTS